MVVGLIPPSFQEECSGFLIASSINREVGVGRKPQESLRNTITRPVAHRRLQDPIGLNMELCHLVCNISWTRKSLRRKPRKVPWSVFLCGAFFFGCDSFFFSASGFGKNDDAIVMQQLHFVCFAEVISWESKDGIPLMPRFLGPKIRRGHKGRQLISWQKTWPFWGGGEPLQVPWI